MVPPVAVLDPLPPPRAPSSTDPDRSIVVAPPVVDMVMVSVSPGVTAMAVAYRKSPPRPPVPLPPHPTQTALMLVTPVGTTKLPDAVNTCCPGWVRV